MESHLTRKEDARAEPLQKYDENVEANLTLKKDVFYGLDELLI